MLPATGRGDIPTLSPAEAGTRFSDYGGKQVGVDVTPEGIGTGTSTERLGRGDNVSVGTCVFRVVDSVRLARTSD